MNIINKLKEFLSPSQIFIPNQNSNCEYLIEKRGHFSSNAQAIVFPSNTLEVSKIVKLCNALNVSIVPQSGNSGLVGGAVSVDSQIILNSKLLNNINKIDTRNYSVSCQGGVILRDLQNFVNKFDLYFPLSLASEEICKIGGNIATNAGGINVLKYGNTKDLVLGIEAVLPNGEIYSDLNQLYKRNIGIDIKNLFIGSEGLFGFICEATLKLFPKPLGKINFIYSAKNIDVIENLFYELKNLFQPFLSSYEIFNLNAFNLVQNTHPNLTGILDDFNTKDNWFAIGSLDLPFLELDDEYKLITNKLHKILLKEKLENIFIGSNNKYWDIRYAIPRAQSIYGKSLKHDISVPISNISKTILTLQANLDSKYDNLLPIIFGHFGDGNLHYNLSSKNNNKDYLETHKINIKSQIIDIVMDLDGTFSAEHGIGLIHKEEFKKFYSHNQYNNLKLLKSTFDKNNIFNPNKIFDKP